MINSFGIFVRKLRLDNSEFLFDMAKKLRVSSAFLSAVETGKKAVPKDFKEKITNLYKLNKSQIEELDKSIKDSVLEIKMPLKDRSIKDRELLVKFARSFENFNDEDKKIMADIINRRNDKQWIILQIHYQEKLLGA